MKDAPEPPSSDDKYWANPLKCVFAKLEALGLSVPAPKRIPKKKGRPRKDAAEQVPKRPRGRPKKNQG
jgi:hypothetical protein